MKTKSLRLSTLGICPLVTIIVGCGLLPSAPEKSITNYTIEIPKCDTGANVQKHNVRLVIEPTKGNSLTDSTRIVFSDQPTIRSFYQYARWTSSPSDMFNQSLLRLAECKGMNSSGSNSLKDEYVLETELIYFLHDAQNKPGSSTIEVRANIYKLPSTQLLKLKTFSLSTALGEYSAQGAVLAFNKGAKEITEQILSWADQKTTRESS